MLRECPQRTAHPSCVQQGCRRTSGLLLSPSNDRDSPLVIDYANCGEPLQHRAEVPQRIAAHAKLDVVGVDEVQPESITDEHERAAICWSEDECGHGDLRSEDDFDVTPQLNSRKQMHRLAR